MLTYMTGSDNGVIQYVAKRKNVSSTTDGILQRPITVSIVWEEGLKLDQLWLIDLDECSVPWMIIPLLLQRGIRLPHILVKVD